MKAGMKMFVVLAAIGGLSLAIAGSALAECDATMVFGNPDVGSGCNFPCTDDASFHAVDKVRPGAVSIAAGETVCFDVNGFHQVAVYDVGIKPRDIEPDPATFPFVEDFDGRLAVGLPTVDFEFVFTTPGKYLVICNVTPHFEESQMWGWVQVK